MAEFHPLDPAVGGNHPGEPRSTGPATGAHEFEHEPDAGREGQRRALRWAFGVNALLLAVEVLGGLAFNSLALLADAMHLLSDVAGLGIALGAVALVTRPISGRHTFGMARAEVLAAGVSGLLLLAAGAWIMFEGVRRFIDPVPVNGAGLAAVAAVALVVNAGSAFVVHQAQGESLNMRASFLHLATDAVGSLGAILAGLLILGFGWLRADSVVSLATAVLVLWAGGTMVRETVHVLMEGSPRGLNPDDVRAVILDVPTVIDVHHLHLWSLASDVPALSGHVVITGEPTLRESQAVASQVKGALVDRFGLTHLTLEVECGPADSAATGSTSRSDPPGSVLGQS